MNSTVSISIAPTLPALYRSRVSNRIVLFDGLESGTCVANPYAIDELDRRDTDWQPCTDTATWERIDVSLTPASDPKSEQPSFPALYRELETGMVVLFTAVDEGTVLYVGDNTECELGERCDYFANCTSGSIWRRLTERDTVTLTGG